MSKNLTRKGLALGTALAFVVTGLTATAPAFAAAGDVVSIAPTTGTGFGAYNTDFLNIDTSIDTDVVTTAAYDKLAIELSHSATAGGSTVTVKLNDGLAGAYVGTTVGTCTATLSMFTLDSLGAATAATATGTYTVASAATDNACNVGLDAAAANTIFTIPFSATVAKVTLDLGAVTGSSALKLSVKATDSASVATVHENEAVSLTSWIDSDEDGKLEATDKFPSTTETATFYDAANVTVTPRVERFVPFSGPAVLNEHAANSLGVSLGFSPALNLDQVDLGEFTWSSTGGTSVANAFTATKLSGNLEHSPSGRIYGLVDDSISTDEFALAASTAFSFSAIRANASVAGNTAVTTTTAGYTVPVQATAGVTAAAGALVDQTDDSEQATTTVTLRSGVKTFKYTMSSTAAAGAVIVNVPVIAQVTATGMASGSTLTVGTAVLKAGQATLVSGVTDADGKFAVSVTSSTASTGEGYSVVFSALLNAGTYSATGTYAAVYAAGAATTMAQSSAILSGSTVEAKFSLKDQFGKAISAKSDGTAYTVRVTAPDTTKLKKYATFAAGAATVSFTNYLSKGQNDTITAAIGTGLDTAYADATITTGDNLTATLYNPEDAAGVTTLASRTGNVTYDDFITGAVSSTNVAPADGSAIAHTGTVVDTSGVGIPGALVTVAGKGLQFVKTTAGTATGDYAQDSITVSADAAGAFEVKIWAHQVSSTGVAVTTTAGGKTATTTLKTYLPATLVNGNNLVFSWALPAVLVKNTTYAVTAKLADKWGNPVATAVNAGVNGVTFQGFGSVEVNSSSAAVVKNFDKTGQVTVFVRSVKDIAGPGSVEATLGAANYSATSGASATALVVTEIASNATATKWDETAFKNILSANVEILDAAPASARVSSSVAGIVGYVATTVRNASGKAVTVTVNGRVLTPRAPNVAAQLFKFRAKAGKTTVVVKVDGVTVSSRTVMVK